MPDPTPVRRMSGPDREQQLLAAAVVAFAGGGYAGTTTDQVARHAGVSQPYVLRRFGTKQALFLAAYRFAGNRIQEAFRTAAEAMPESADVPDRLTALGAAYLNLAHDRDLLMVMQHGFMASADPGLGPAMRACMSETYRLIRDLTGADAEQARDFLARGMLMNTLIALLMPAHQDEDPDISELVRVTFEMEPAQRDHRS